MTAMWKKVLRRSGAVLLSLFMLEYVGVGVVRSLYLESTPVKLALPHQSGITATVRVAHISDLHRAVFGENNRELVDLVASKRPDLIVATGDMIDVTTRDIADTVDLFGRLAAIAPVLYSLGNNEMARSDLRQLIDALKGIGVTVLDDSAVMLTVNGLRLRVGGVYGERGLRAILREGPVDILLCHYPDLFRAYVAGGVPVTFCGHTHGGQFRIPLLDIPLYAPGQGLFPKYAQGVYEQDGCYMVVSRGLGNSSFPFRIHNPPEVIIADIAFGGDSGTSGQ